MAIQLKHQMLCPGLLRSARNDAGSSLGRRLGASLARGMSHNRQDQWPPRGAYDIMMLLLRIDCRFIDLAQAAAPSKKVGGETPWRGSPPAGEVPGLSHRSASGSAQLAHEAFYPLTAAADALVAIHSNIARPANGNSTA